MNRSSCLSVLIVGLSLTTTSAVFAAPSASNRPTKQVALNAQQSDSGSSSDPTAAPPQAPAPAAPTTAPAEATPAVTLGAPPPADAPSASAAEPTAKPKPRPFAGSSMFIQNSMTTNTIFQGQTQYSNPTVESSLWLMPRYAINDAFQLRGRMIVGYEYTNADDTTTNHEPTLSDLTLQLFYRKIPKLPLGIQPAVALNVGLPTSKASRARTLYFTPGATLQLTKGIEHFFGGEAMILANTTYSHPLYRSQNPEIVDPQSYSFTCVGGTNCGDLLSGTMNPSDTLSYAFLFSPEWGKWNPAIYYLGASQWVYHPKEVTYNGLPVQRATGANAPTSVRQTHYVSVWLDYNFNSWITGEVGFWNSISAIGASGQRANLIFDRYQDTRVYLGASIQLDNLVKELQGGSEGEGGIVRAKNTKTPMWSF